MESLDNKGNSAKVPKRFRSRLAGAQDMKNVYEVLRQKEMELTRLEKEVEALRLVAPLLSEEKENGEASKSALPTAVNGPQAARITVPSAPSMPAPQPVRRDPRLAHLGGRAHDHHEPFRSQARPTRRRAA